MEDRKVDFETTMQGLADGLRVEAISAFSLETCCPDDTVQATLQRMNQTGFDQYPVRENGRILGVLDRLKEPSRGLVKEAMSPLREEMLVAASDRISTLLPLLREVPYRLVVRDGKISGIVTSSDIIRLPVRLYAFAQITHLEMLMAEHIGLDFSYEQQWLDLLSVNRRDKVLDKIKTFNKAGLDPSPVEFTDFCDKRVILKKGRGLGKQFERELKEVEELRNTLAHAGDYGQTVPDLHTFIDRVDLVKKWINELALLPDAVAESPSP